MERKWPSSKRFTGASGSLANCINCGNNKESYGASRGLVKRILVTFLQEFLEDGFYKKNSLASASIFSLTKLFEL